MTRREIARMKAKCKRLGISHRAIALEAGVTRPMVSLVFLHRAISRNVVDAALRLLAQHVGKDGNGQSA